MNQNDRTDILQEFCDLCSRVGLKVTTPRLAVYRYMKDNTEHPKVAKVWEGVKRELPTISRETVYRVLNDLASHDVIRLLDPADVTARYDASVQRHDHFFCSQCGRVYDFTVPDLPDLVQAQAETLGRIDYVEVRAYGVCRQCLDMSKEE